MSFCKAPLTGDNLSNQEGKVFIVTGGSSGIGKALVRILFQRHATVYIAARNKEKTQSVIDEIAGEFPASKGRLIFLHLELNDLSTIKARADQFLANETRLDVLWNNAAIMEPPDGSVSKQGYEQQLGVNVLAPFLFTLCLRDIMIATAKTAPPGSVRVCWVSSIGATYAPKPAIDFDNMDYVLKNEGAMTKYNRSKAGTCLHSYEFQRRYGSHGIVSVSIEPGLHETGLQKEHGAPRRLLLKVIGSAPENGAFAELYAGLSPDVTQQAIRDGHWVTGSSKLKANRADYVDQELGKKYWEWTEAQIRPYI